jgi:phospholipid-binding lipoprotein MlaA
MKNSKIKTIFCLVVIVFCFSYMIMPSFVFADEDEEMSELMGEYEEKNEQTHVADPLYWVNYGVFQFNDKMYHWFVRPASKGYKFAVPEEIRYCVGNFFTNLLFPIRFVNNLLQGDFKAAGTEAGIFFINTTAGGLGLGQPAQEALELKDSDEDFGQTLGTWHFGEGIYLVWPFLGPSTLRDTLGMAGDSLLYPLNYLDAPELVLGSRILYTINSSSYRLDDYKTFREGAIDPYTALKNIYIQQRQEKIKE